jgi:tetratricopeptide (TPR) repeat protein
MILSKKAIDIVDLKETFKNSKNMKFKEALIVNLLRDKRNCSLIKEFSSDLIESEPRFWNAYYFMALCEDAEGNYRASIQYINSGLSYYPSNAQMLEARFLLEVRLSLIDDAKNTLNLIKYYKPNYQGIMDLERVLMSISASQVPDL